MTQYPGFDRIASACFVDGDDDQHVVEFFHAPGSVLRTCYNRRTTVTTRQWISPITERDAFDRLVSMANATFYAI